MANQADAQTHLEKADVLSLAGQYEEATAEYAKAIESGDSNVSTLNNWGVALRNLKKYDDAIEKYKQATLADPKYAMAFYNWGNALYDQKKYDDAIEKYQQATELDPSNLSAFNTWGLAQSGGHRTGKKRGRPDYDLGESGNQQVGNSGSPMTP